MIAAMNEGSSSLPIHGINLSLGSNFDPANYSCGHTPLCQELRRLWRQGVIICLAAGNEGYSMLRSDSGLIHANMPLSISDPANLDEAIAIGSVHRPAAQIRGFVLLTRPHRRRPQEARIW